MQTQQLSMLASPAFEANQRIPTQYTCDGQNLSPPLAISAVPASTHSLALIVDDPDAPRGTFTHWILWNIPVQTQSIEEGQTPKGAISGLNDFKHAGYGGPCPPSGTHRYRFKLYALDSEIGLPPGSTLSDLQHALQGHVLAESVLQGTYSRQ